MDSLKKVLQGQSALDMLDDDEELFEEISEDEFDERQRLIDRDEFVVDDPQGLYAAENNDRQPGEDSYESLEDEELDSDGEPTEAGKKRRRPKEKKEKKKAFGAGAPHKRPLPAGQSSLKAFVGEAVQAPKANPFAALIDDTPAGPPAAATPASQTASQPAGYAAPPPTAPRPAAFSQAPRRSRGRGRGAARRAPPAVAAPGSRFATPPPARFASPPKAGPPKRASTEGDDDEAMPEAMPETVQEEQTVEEPLAAPPEVGAGLFDDLEVEEPPAPEAPAPEPMPEAEAEAKPLSRAALVKLKRKQQQEQQQQQQRASLKAFVDGAAQAPKATPPATAGRSFGGPGVQAAEGGQGAAAFPPGEPLAFFWTDLNENRDGSVSLFGKAPQGIGFRTLTVQCPEVAVPIFLVPRKPWGDQVEEEILQAVQTLIPKIDFLGQAVERMAVFDNPNRLGAPCPRKGPGPVIKILISSRWIRQLPSALGVGGHHPLWTHALGAGLSVTDHLMIKRRIMGPCWLRIAPECADRATGQRKPTWRTVTSTGQNDTVIQLAGLEGLKALRVWGDRKPSEEMTEGEREGQERRAEARRERFGGEGGPEDKRLEERPRYADGPAPAAPPMKVMAIKLLVLTHKDSKKREVFAFSLLTTTLTDEMEDQLNKRTQWTHGLDRFEGGGPLDHSARLVIGFRRPKASFHFPAAYESLASDSKRRDCQAPVMYTCPTEKALLSVLQRSITQLDPDVITGHTLVGGDLDVLYARMQTHKLVSRGLGRLRNGPALGDVKFSQHQQRVAKALFPGVLVVDVAQAAREFLPHQVTYQPEALCQYFNFPDWLYQRPADGEGRATFSPAAQSVFGSVSHHILSSPPLEEAVRSIEQSFNLTAPDPLDPADMGPWVAVADHLILSNQAALHTLGKLSALSITRQLSTLAGYPWQGSCFHQRAERNASMLNHAFYSYKALLPDGYHLTRDGSKDRPKGSYEGGLVLDPKAGLYETFVMLLDFNSLYPSIIQEFNLCWTTVDASKEDLSADDTADVGVKGVLPEILTTLVSRRKQVKKDLATVSELLNKGDLDAERRKQMESKRKTLDTLSMALKLSANSIYGCLGFAQSRYYARSIAAAITAAGRRLLGEAKEMVEESMRLTVVYGDTDSIMVDTGISDGGIADPGAYRDVLDLGARISGMVSKKYRHLELELEDVYCRLLLQKKKKYAFIKVKDYPHKTSGLQMKGLDLVRRDWSILSKIVGRQVLESLFSAKTQDDAVSRISELLRTVGATSKKLKAALEADLGAAAFADLVKPRGTDEAGSVTVLRLQDFVITKALTKLPEAYAGSATQPHVLVAKQMIESGISVPPGTEINYVVCTEKLGDAILRYDGGKTTCRKPEAVPAPKTTGGGDGEGGLFGSNKPKEKTNPLACAVSPEDAKFYGMIPNLEWYMKQQIFPPVLRLLSCLPAGILDSDLIQEMLGIESRVRTMDLDETAADTGHVVHLPSKGGKALDHTFSDAAKELADAHVLISCDACGRSLPLARALEHTPPSCPVCSAGFALAHLENVVDYLQGSLMEMMITSTLKCTECSRETPHMRMTANQCHASECALSRSPEGSVFPTKDESLAYDILVYLSTCCQSAYFNQKSSFELSAGEEDPKVILLTWMNAILRPKKHENAHYNRVIDEKLQALKKRNASGTIATDAICNVRHRKVDKDSGNDVTNRFWEILLAKKREKNLI